MRETYSLRNLLRLISLAVLCVVVQPRAVRATANLELYGTFHRGYAGETATLEGADPATFTWTAQGGGVYKTTIHTPDPYLVVAGGLYTTSPSVFVKWVGLPDPWLSTLAELQAQTGQELHGLNAVPGFMDEANGDFHLGAGSPLIDAGVVIPGINNQGAHAYQGAAPDIGAYELPASSTTPTATATSTAMATPTPTATDTPTPTATPSDSSCVRDANGNGIGDVVDIQVTATDSDCRTYLPLVAAQWRQPWPTPTPRPPYPDGEPGTAQIHEPGWSTPIKLRFNDDGWEDSPYITRDGSQIIFFYHPYPDIITRADEITEFVVNHPEEAVALGIDGKLYISDRPFTSRRVHPISQNDSPALECCAYLSPSGDLYYNSTRRSWELMQSVPVTVYRNGERLDFGTGQDESNPHYCAAKDELWFDCPGDANLCVMRNAAASNFQGEVELAPYPVNARDYENIQDSQAFLTDDCNTLYITSSRDYPDLEITQIYRLRRLDAEGRRWSEPELFISNETTIAELSMTADGTELVFAQIFWRQDGTPGINIYYSHREMNP